MNRARCLTIAILVSLLLAAVAGCGGGGGSTGSGLSLAPGPSAGNLTVKVTFSDQAPRLEVQGDQVLLSTSEETEKLVIDVLDDSGTPVVGTTVAERTVGDALTVIIREIPYGRWRLRILAYDSSDRLVGRFEQEVLIEPGVNTSVSATVTPVYSPSPSPSPFAGGTFVYVADTNGNTVTGYTLDSSRTLAPIPGSPWSTNWITPTDLAVSSSNDFLFSAQSGTAGVGGFQSFRIGSGGVLSNAGVSAVPVANKYPWGVAAHPTLNRLYGTMSDSVVGGILAGTFDPTGGTLDMGPPVSGLQLGFVAVHPAGSHLYAAYPTMVGIWDLDASGNLVPNDTHVMPAEMGGMKIHPNGKYLFATVGSTGRVYSRAIDSAGRLSAINDQVVGTDVNPLGMAVSQDGNYLFVAVGGNADVEGWVQILSISGTGQLTTVGSAVSALVGPHPMDVTVAPDGTVLVISATSANVAGQLRPFTFTSGVLTPTGQVVNTGNMPMRVVTATK